MEPPASLAQAKSDYVGRRIRKLFVGEAGEKQWFSGTVKSVWKSPEEGILYHVM